MLRDRMLVVMLVGSLAMSCTGGDDSTEVEAVDTTPTVTATPLPTTATPQADATPAPTVEVGTASEYEVVEGDTLGAIAERFGVSLDALMALNGITDPTALQIGTVLQLPAPGAEPPDMTPTPTPTPTTDPGTTPTPTTTTEPTPAPTPDPNPQGASLYAIHCASCHGAAGEGGTGPALGGGLLDQNYPNIADAIALVTNGVSQMPGFGLVLDAEQIAVVVNYAAEL